MKICLLGLGEAGSAFATDLVAAGVEVSGFDPAPVVTPAGVTRFDDPNAAITGVSLVIAMTAAADAVGALEQCLDRLGQNVTQPIVQAPVPVVYADASTCAPLLKRQLAAKIASSNGGVGVTFAGVALMGMIPGNGLAVPALVSGEGASRYCDLLNPVGANAQALEGGAGLAASRKLLRSVFMKGVAALVIEAQAAAQAAGDEAWLTEHLERELELADGPWIQRLLAGTPVHAERRWHEMEAATEMLETLGIDPNMTKATVRSLQTLVEKVE